MTEQTLTFIDSEGERYLIDLNSYKVLRREKIIDGWNCCFMGRQVFNANGVFLREEWDEEPISRYRFGDLPFTQADQDNIDSGVYLAAPRKKWWEVWK